MKTYSSLFLSFFVFLIVACSSDDDNLTPQKPTPVSNVIVEFDNDFRLFESTENTEVKLKFNKAAIEDGIIEIGISIPENLIFFTIPSASNGVIRVPVNKGDSHATFNLIPDNDNIIKGMRDISFTLKSTSSGFEIGEKDHLEVELIDDELYGKPKSFETTAGNWKVSKTYTYAADGKIQKIDWKKETPNLSTGTDTYYYLNGKLARINYSENLDEYFYWNDDKISSSEMVKNGEKTSLSTYEYNPEGSIASQTLYHPDETGMLKVSFVFAYIYFSDGNLNKQITFIPDTSFDGYAVISQRTHDNYSEKLNRFPVNEIVPTIITQKNLPGSYRIEENGTDLIYSFSYEFDSDNRAIKRSTSNEITTYSYY
ncbi:hypothetical protein MKO06_13855 [Gramella sp. GC03-9]|uniref:YD repeat-containing protein n=1 Tax=Christiangramia oceanisediminis TaxID=2920386 RepID=A0A9X2KZ18_9FLAO|nr:hypothetical protein [Gramella oceanisediminis]MCP9200998.1 hypothetical protein [Gramella oceanisediminis]